MSLVTTKKKLEKDLAKAGKDIEKGFKKTKKEAAKLKKDASKKSLRRLPMPKGERRKSSIKCWGVNAKSWTYQKSRNSLTAKR